MTLARTARPTPLVSVLALALVGCGCGGAPPAADPAPASAGTYSIHEWGVVRGEAGDRLRLSATAPPQAATYFFDPGAVVEKPILYFHVDGNAPIALRSLRVTVDDRIVEHWPYVEAPLAPASVAWSGWTIRREHCEASRYPSTTEAPCGLSAATDDCEAAGLRAHESASSACLEREGERANMLFYRSSTRVAPPLVLRREAGALLATSTTDEAMPDTLVVRVRGAQAAMVPAPSPRGHVILPEPSSPSADAVRALRESMTRRGLDDGEIDAFWRAWEATLTGDPNRSIPALPSEGEPAEEDLAEETPTERTPREQPPPPPADRVFYFLPPSSIEAMSRLEADPPPREVVRVFAVIQAVPEH